MQCRLAEAPELLDRVAPGRPPRERGQRLVDHCGEPPDAAVMLHGSEPCTRASALPTALRSVGDACRAIEPCGERRGLVVAGHHDCVLDRARVMLGSDSESVEAVRHQAHDAPVERGCEAAVEVDLGVAERAPALERPVVQEREPHRLLDLVGLLAGQEHPRDVGLAELNAPGQVRERSGIHRASGRPPS